MDVQYAVQPDGQLLANNNLVLNQLSFGDKVEGAPNSLPVKLAVALLADRNGVIDINLPISGSLNDPQFSIGAVVWKIFTNLVTKALTAPFSLLANAFSGSQSEDHSTVNFAPGSSALAAEVAQGLDKIAQALADRPALHVTVVGTASPALERDAFKRERLKVLLLAEKRRRAAVGGQDVSAVAVLTDAEYPVLLKDVYRRADIAKPRNLVGLAKDLPVAEMEALLLASISVTEDAIHTLAQQRGVAVKDYLASRKVGVERLFLGAPKIVAPDGDNASDAPWKPHAELSVTSR
jgi:outer membrane protein OmpA-like peptidoglycan-associated protein